jgi:hypothetical protein
VLGLGGNHWKTCGFRKARSPNWTKVSHAVVAWVSNGFDAVDLVPGKTGAKAYIAKARVAIDLVPALKCVVAKELRQN